MRNPLNSLLGAKELFINKQADIGEAEPEKQINPKLLYSAKFSEEILHDLIGNILDFSKLRAGKMDLLISSVDLREKLYNLVNMFTNQATKKKIGLEYHADEGMPVALQVDYHKLNQVVINLLGNSIKFTKYGRVVLKTNWYEFPDIYPDSEKIKAQISILKAESSREDILLGVDENLSPLNLYKGAQRKASKDRVIIYLYIYD